MIEPNTWKLWENRIAEIDRKAEPIASRPALLENILKPFSEEEKQFLTGLSSENQDLLEELIQAYQHAESGEREGIREFFKQYPAFQWAVTYHMKADTDEELRKSILYLSILDQGHDTRDFLLRVRHLVQYARERKLDIHSALRECARLSSPEDRYGWGSTREIFLNAIPGIPPDRDEGNH